MKTVKNPKVGDLVQIPTYCYAPHRSGWNGWIFRVGTIQKIGKSAKTGKKVAVVKYCKATGGRYKLLPCQEETKVVPVEHLFQWNYLELHTRNYHEFKNAEESGELICWDEDTSFLVSNGFIK